MKALAFCLALPGVLLVAAGVTLLQAALWAEERAGRKCNKI